MNTPKSIPVVDEYFDTRRSLKDGSYPIKIKVYNPTTQEKRFYNSGIRMSQTEYDLSTSTKRLSLELRTKRETLEAIKAKARNAIQSLPAFGFKPFEEQFLAKKEIRQGYAPNSVQEVFQQKIVAMMKEERISTAQGYEQTLKSLSKFARITKRPSLEKTLFADIDVDWLQAYQKHMIQNENRTTNTVGIYLRNLRTLFNERISNKKLDRELYPFGKYKYQIPATRNVKKALDPELLSKLYKARPISPYQSKAKDFFLLSFLLNGINVKDLLQLRHKDYQEDRITFVRSKTKNTTKTHQQPIIVSVSESAKEIIAKYQTTPKGKDDYLFPILSKEDSPVQIHNKSKAFTRFIDQHVKALAQELGIEEKVSYLSARHSFATAAIRSGASMELIQTSLGHSNIKTTQNYFAGFGNDTHDELAKTIEKLLMH
jgi:site-specific recombinase XerD